MEARPVSKVHTLEAAFSGAPSGPGRGLGFCQLELQDLGGFSYQEDTRLTFRERYKSETLSIPRFTHILSLTQDALFPAPWSCSPLPELL